VQRKKVKVDKRMPRTKGKVNYKTNDLIEVIEKKLPQGAEGWKEVAVLYKVKTSENVLRDYEDLKRHWVEKLCNRFKKPTGSTGSARSDIILRCQRVQAKILEKSNSLMMGIDDNDEETSDDNDNDDNDEDFEVLTEEHEEANTDEVSHCASVPNPVGNVDESMTNAVVSTLDSAFQEPAAVQTSTAKRKNYPDFPLRVEKSKNSQSSHRGNISKAIENIAAKLFEADHDTDFRNTVQNFQNQIQNLQNSFQGQLQNQQNQMMNQQSQNQFVQGNMQNMIDYLERVVEKVKREQKKSRKKEKKRIKHQKEEIHGEEVGRRFSSSSSSSSSDSNDN